SVHLTSLSPNTFSPFLFISSFTFSNFPSTFIVLTFHVPILSIPPLVLGSGFRLLTTEGDPSLHLPPPLPTATPPPFNLALPFTPLPLSFSCPSLIFLWY